jgi:hypothetical protein
MVNDPLFGVLVATAIAAMFAVIGWVAGQLIKVVMAALNVGE